jgi:GT2 family glycosyltransferase
LISPQNLPKLRMKAVTASMGLAVVLINWRQEERTLRCVRAVAGWHALKPRVIVVDNESTEATYSALSAAVPDEDLICSTVNNGYAGGNNLGIKRALAAELDFVLLLNTDAEISSAGVSQLLARLDACAQIAIIGPVVNESDDRQTRRHVGGRDIASHSLTRISMSPAHSESLMGYPVQAVDYVPGTVFLARGSVFEEIGFLDEEYFFSGEIADFCKRARDRGHKVCVDLEVEAQHHTNQTQIHRRETLYLYYGLRNRFLYVRKHYPGRKLRYFAYWTMRGALGFARAVLQGEMERARAILLAVVHGYRGRYGNQNAALV